MVKNKKGWCLAAGLVLGVVFLFGGCQRDTRETDERAEQMEIAEEELNQAVYTGTTKFMEQSDAEIAYDFSSVKDGKAQSRGTLEDADAALYNGASCTVDSDYGSMLVLSGGRTGDSPYAALPQGTFDKLSEFSVMMNVQLADPDHFYHLFCINGGEAKNFSISVSGKKMITSFQAAPGREVKKTVVKFSRNRTGEWLHFAVVVRNMPDNYYADTYVDGELAGSFCFDGYGISDLGQGQEAWIGKPPADNKYLKGRVADFRLYFHPMEAKEIKSIYSESFDRLQSIGFAKRLKKTMLGKNTSTKRVIFNLKFPDTYEGYPVQWAFDNTDGIVKKSGQVTLDEEKVKKVKVTAIFAGHMAEYTIKVQPRSKWAKMVLSIAADHVVFKNSRHIKKDIQLPNSVKAGTELVAVQWESDHPAVISDTDSDNVPKGTVTRKKLAKEVTLTGVFTYEGESLTKKYHLRVKAKE